VIVTGFVRNHPAAFHLPPEAAGCDPHDDFAKRLEIESFPAIDADRSGLAAEPELTKNGRSLAVTPGADLASSDVGMWLGEEPVDSRLRAELRGGLHERARN
jgi:hypothetical protein